MKSASYFFPFACFIYLSGCATSSHQLFQQISVGNNKSEVLEILGSPSKTYRQKEQDIWIYFVTDQNQNQEPLQQIIFKDNKVIKIIPQSKDNSADGVPPSSEESSGLMKAQTWKEYEREVEKLHKNTEAPKPPSNNQTNENEE